MKRIAALFLVVGVVVGLAVPAATLDFGGTDGGVASAGSNSTGAAQRNGTQGAGACNYQSLYDETIDSVVLVATASGQGSGFVYRVGDDGTGYVVTNQHVVNRSSRVRVRFHGGETRRGTVVGTDVYSDLAAIRVPNVPDDAAALPVADGAPEPGQPVAALGSPYGLQGTITSGIVSGVNRSMPTEQGFTIPDSVQTDAPINPGNSGGPLVSCDGTVLGVNRAGGGDNIGFAISPTLIQRVVPALIENGSYRHPYLGVATASLTPALARANDLNVTEGVYVGRVVQGSPAAGVLQGAQGVRTVDGQRVPVGGDVIVSIEGRQIGSPEELGSYLATETRPGETVELTIVRDGERRTVELTIGTRPAPETN